jgi:hypothetical protein
VELLTVKPLAYFASLTSAGCDLVNGFGPADAVGPEL